MTAATPGEKLTIYAAGLVQGITLVTFPGREHDLHLERVVKPIRQPIRPHVRPPGHRGDLGVAWRRQAGQQDGLKSVYLGSLTANLASMGLLILSRFVVHGHGVAFALLLAATACLGFASGSPFRR